MPASLSSPAPQICNHQHCLIPEKATTLKHIQASTNLVMATRLKFTILLITYDVILQIFGTRGIVWSFALLDGPLNTAVASDAYEGIAPQRKMIVFIAWKGCAEVQSSAHQLLDQQFEASVPTALLPKPPPHQAETCLQSMQGKIVGKEQFFLK